jgi:hypothetical protein
VAIVVVAPRELDDAIRHNAATNLQTKATTQVLQGLALYKLIYPGIVDTLASAFKTQNIP